MLTTELKGAKSRKSAEFCNGDAVFTLAVNAQTVFLDELVALKTLMDSLAQSAGAFPVNDGDGTQLGADSGVDIILHHTCHKYQLLQVD